MLVEAGADVNATTPDGISAVVIALINGHYDVAGALVEAGTDPNLADYDGPHRRCTPPIDINTMPKSNRPAPKVIENRLTSLDVARLLLERGADVNAQLKRLPPYRAKLDRGNDTHARRPARRRSCAPPKPATCRPCGCCSSTAPTRRWRRRAAASTR